MARDKLNCWEFTDCGRQPGGLMAAIHGVCPTAVCMKLDGTNGGQAAGRACWMVTNNGCRRLGRTCHTCEFYRRVVFEEEAPAHRFASAGV